MMQLLATCILVVGLVLPSLAATELTNGTTGYEYFLGFGYYKFYTQGLKWAQAVRTCVADGGQLGIVNSDEEAEVYKTIIARHAKNGYFLAGFMEYQDSRDFLTLDGVSLEKTGYSKWASGEPNNGPSKPEKCGSITAAAELNDISCTESKWFICEIKYPATLKWLNHTSIISSVD